MPSSFSRCSYHVLQPNDVFSTNRGTPLYYSLLKQIEAVAQMRLDNVDLRKGTHKSVIQELPVSISAKNLQGPLGEETTSYLLQVAVSNLI